MPMEKQAMKTEKEVKGALLRVVVAVLAGVCLTVIQVVTQYDAEKRMLSQGFFTSLVNVIVVLVTIYVAGEFFVITQKLKVFSAELKLNSVPIVGISMILSAVCFFVQSISDVNAVIEKGNMLLKAAVAVEKDAGIATFFGDRNALAAVGALLCILSAVSFLVDGVSMIKKSRPSPFWLRLVPPAWAGITLLNVMMSYPSVVSAQGDVSKVFSCILTVLFLLYSSSVLCGVKVGKKYFSSLFIRLSYPALMFLTVFPYGLSMLFFTKHETVNIPHFAYAGLIVFSAMSTIQLVLMSMYEMKKRSRHQRGDFSPASARKYSTNSSDVKWSYFDE